MKLNTVVFLLNSLPAIVLAGKANKIKSNPKDVVALADFPAGGDSKVKGNIVFSARDGGKVNVHVDVTGLPPNSGPFHYHIHENAISDNGDCESAGDSFNPYGASNNCDEQKNDGYCEVGDLSGKHGWIDTTCFETKYTDPYLSLNKKSKSYIVGKSIVFHFPDQTRFACANINLIDPEKVDALIHDNQVEDIDTINALSYKVEEDYSFNDEAEIENQDDDEDEDDKEGTSKDKNKEDKPKYEKPSKNGTWDDHEANHTNKTIYKPQQLSSDCENGSSQKTFGFVAGLAGVLGLLL